MITKRKTSIKELEDPFEISQKVKQKGKNMEHRKDKKMTGPVHDAQHLNRSSVKRELEKKKKRES